MPGYITIQSFVQGLSARGQTHSFPTRRSSDLTFTANGRTVIVNGTAAQTILKTGGETLAALSIDKASGNLVLGSKDRQSTRLRSMHVIISYGVVDLKKKKVTLSGGGGDWLSGG